MAKKLYKVLTQDMVSPYQNMQYEIGKLYTCENFDTNFKEHCSHGFYATGIDGLPYAMRPDKRLFLCDVSGKLVEIDQFKRRYEKIKLVREVPKLEIKALLRQEIPKVGYNILEAVYPINPLEGGPKEIMDKDVENLELWSFLWNSVWDSVWASVWDSVRDSVRDSVWISVRDSVRDSVWISVRASVENSVRDSVRDSVWISVRDSVRDSVMDFVGAYVSSLFFGIKKWKEIDHAEGLNPFQPAIDLWRRGFLPSFDGETWRLHTGEHAKVVYMLTELHLQ